MREVVDRRSVEASLADVVAGNRYTIAVVVPLAGALTLVGGATGVVPASVAYAPPFVLAGVLVLRLPLVAALAPVVDRRAAALGLALCAYTYGVEYVGLHTGWPYGQFAYGVHLGPAVAGVPLALPLLFVPLVLDAYLLALLLLGPASASGWRRRSTAIALVLVVDLVLDPGAVALGFWTYPTGGAYYGVPVSNYLGWALSATVAVLLVDAAFDHRTLRRVLRDRAFALDDLASFVVLWGVVALAFGHLLPAFLAASLALLLATGRRVAATRARVR